MDRVRSAPSEIGPRRPLWRKWHKRCLWDATGATPAATGGASGVRLADEPLRQTVSDAGHGTRTAEADSPGRKGPPQVGEFSWHELATSDYEAGFDFYSALFGWEKTTKMEMGEMGVYQIYGSGEHELGGMYNLLPKIPAPPYWLLYARVPDVEAAAETIKSLGGQVLNGPMEVPGGDRVVQAPGGGVRAAL